MVPIHVPGFNMHTFAMPLYFACNTPNLSQTDHDQIISTPPRANPSAHGMIHPQPGPQKHLMSHRWTVATQHAALRHHYVSNNDQQRSGATMPYCFGWFFAHTATSPNEFLSVSPILSEFGLKNYNSPKSTLSV